MTTKIKIKNEDLAMLPRQEPAGATLFLSLQERASFNPAPASYTRALRLIQESDLYPHSSHLTIAILKEEVYRRRRLFLRVAHARSEPGRAPSGCTPEPIDFADVTRKGLAWHLVDEPVEIRSG
jgi:hypothetical protein